MFRTVTPIFSIILAIAIFLFFTSDIVAEIKAKQVEIASYDEVLKSVKDYNLKLEAMLKTKDSVNALEAENLNTLISNDTDEIRLLVDLTEMARSHNMLLGNISVEKGTKIPDAQEGDVSATTIQSSDFIETNISFGLIGTYDQFKSMLLDMEKSMVLLEVTNITFTANEGPFQQFEMKVRSYALKSAI